MSVQTIKPETLNSAGRGAAQKNGRQPEGADRSEINMLKVVDKPAKGKIDPTPYLNSSPDRKAALWLTDLVNTSQNSVSTMVVELTPELARTLLASNPANRNISELTVQNYVRDMKGGAWRLNGEPIIVARDGSLNDGQHRCMAVIISGVSIRCVMIVGVERDTRTTLDQGRIRTLGDYLAMEGHSYSNSLAVASRMIWQWQRYGLVSSSPQYRPTKSELLSLVDATPKIERAIHAVSHNSIAAIGSLGMMAFLHFALSVAAPVQEVEGFISAISTGENLSGSSPILYVRNRLLAEKSRLKVGERAELVFKSWNAFRRNETPKAIPLLGGDLPLLES